MLRGFVVTGTCAVVAFAAGFSACGNAHQALTGSATGTSEGSSSGNSSGASNGNSGGASSGSSSGDNSPGTGNEVGFGNGTQGSSSGATTSSGHDASTCAASTIAGQSITTTKQVPTTVTVLSPVGVYIMLDQSGSMSELSAEGYSSKWTVATNGITAFVNDPASAGVDVAFNVFPAMGTKCPPTDCTGADYATPLVAFGALPGNAKAVTSAFPTGPYGGCTPTEPALRASEKSCSDYHMANPSQKCVVVFVTDGVPNGCSADMGVLSGIAANALMQDGTLTFAVGMNVPANNASEIDFNLLDAIAKAGGTNCNPPNAGNEACNIGGGSELGTALNEIRTKVSTTTTKTVTTTMVEKVPCEWAVPPPPDGGTLDPTKVNVTFTTGGKTTEIGNVATSGDCSSVASGWYYDDPKTPTTIVVCPDTCTTIQAASDAKIGIALGCETETAIPK